MTDFLMSYVDVDGFETERRLRARSVERTKAGLVLNGICLDTSAPRTFRLDGIQYLANDLTGEVYPSLEEALRPFAPNGLDPTLFARRRGPRRVLKDPGAFVDGWAFRVPMPGAAAALDIRLTERRRQVYRIGRKVTESVWVWTRGQPAEFAFETGDIFHSREMPEAGSWAEQTRCGATIQVTAHRAGELQISVSHHASAEREIMTISPARLEEILREGL